MSGMPSFPHPLCQYAVPDIVSCRERTACWLPSGLPFVIVKGGAAWMHIGTWHPCGAQREKLLFVTGDLELLCRTSVIAAISQSAVAGLALWSRSCADKTCVGEAPRAGLVANVVREAEIETVFESLLQKTCLLYTSPSPRDQRGSRMPSSA